MFLHEKVELDNLESVNVDGKRLYRIPGGELYPSVTTITGLHSKDAILAWRKRVGEAEANKISGKAANRGTKVHKMCEDYLNNELDLSSHLPNSVGLFKQIQPFIDKYVDVVYGIETPLYSDHLKVAGRTDCVAQFHGKPAIVDFKTASKPKSEDFILNYFMQCSAYAVMFEERTKIPIPRIAILIAVEGDQPQLFVKKRDTYIEQFIEYRKKYDELDK